LAESNVGGGRPALAYVHFEIERDRVHIVTTDGRALLHTEVPSSEGLIKAPIAFDVRAMPRITAKKADVTVGGKSLACFVVKDGLITSGDIVARISVDVGFPKWRQTFPSHACLERETAWRSLDPKYYALAQKYLPNGGCGVVSFVIKGGRPAAEAFMKKLRLAAIETHVADARTCCLNPATSTHRQMTDAQLEAAGIPAGLVRMSCGLEDKEDLIADIKQALE
jgi:hypothetical protein